MTTPDDTELDGAAGGAPVDVAEADGGKADGALDPVAAAPLPPRRIESALAWARQAIRDRPDGTGTVVLAWVAAQLALVAAAVWAWWNGWTPAGDRSLIGMGARLTAHGHTPLLGMISSLGVRHVNGPTVSVHHLGPLQLWALAPTDLLTGSRPIGQLLGILLVESVSLALVAWATHRVLGTTAATGMLAASVAMAYGLGPVVLRDSWNPHIVIYPLLAMACLAMALAAGHQWALPWLVLVGSFVAQTHLSVIALAAVVCAWGLGAFLWRWFRDAPATEDGRRRSIQVPVLTATAIAVVTWAPPIIQQLTGGSKGNLGLLVQTLGQKQGRAGPSFIASRLVSIASIPPVWTRRVASSNGFHAATGTSVLVAIVLVGAFVLVGVRAVANRKADPARAAVTTTALVVIVASVINLAITPDYGTLAMQYQRWLWPFGLFIWFAFVIDAAAAIRDWAPQVADPLASPTWAGVGVVVALVLSPLAMTSQQFPRSDGWADRYYLRSVSAQLRHLLPDEPTYLSFAGEEATLSDGPEIMRRLLVDGRSIRVPPAYAPAMFDHWIRKDSDTFAQSLAILSSANSLAPSTRPVAVGGLAVTDEREGERWSVLVTKELHDLPADASLDAAPGEVQASVDARAWSNDASGDVTALLHDTGRALFDRQLMDALAAGQITSPSISAADAREIAHGLDAAQWLAIILPPPTGPAT